MTAFRENDMGTTIDEYSTVSFVKSIYPQAKRYGMNKKGRLTSRDVKGSVSESMIPYSLLNMNVDTINKYVERWTGNNPHMNEGENIRKIVDFDYYISYIKNLSDRLIVNPASVQGININILDLFDEKLAGTMSMDAFMSASTPRRIPNFEEMMRENNEEEPKPKEKPIKKKEEKKTYRISDFIS